jgi:hypothetical protein
VLLGGQSGWGGVKWSVLASTSLGPWSRGGRAAAGGGGCSEKMFRSGGRERGSSMERTRETTDSRAVSTGASGLPSTCFTLSPGRVSTAKPRHGVMRDH